MTERSTQWSRRGFLARSGSGLAALSLAQSCPPLFAAPPAPALVMAGDGRTLSSLRFAQDAFPTEYIEPGQHLGEVHLAWRRIAGRWQPVDTNTVEVADRTILPASGGGCAARYTAGDKEGKAIALESRLDDAGQGLRWTVAVSNLSPAPIEIGDLALPLPMHTGFDEKAPPTASVFKHSMIAGHGSFLFWMRLNSVGPYLLMTPEADTSLEFWDRIPGGERRPEIFRVFVHSAAQGERVEAEGGRWRQPHTTLRLGAGERKEYGFRLAGAGSYDAVRDRLAAEGLLDIEVAPGMTVPTDLHTTIALRSSNPVIAVEPEHQAQSTVEPLPSRGDYQLFRVQFRRPGENLLTVRQRDGRVTRVEFFATEPIETLIQKRGAFIANHRHTDATKWYQGLLAEWNMDSGVLLGPDNYDRIGGWRIYEVTCDDPGLSKPAFLASKLAEYPDQQQMIAMDDYIQHFVWGGLQRTTEETDSYGIYGILDWKRNRDSTDPGDKGQRHMWRPYDYPHIVVMYWGMYRAARDFPGIRTRLTRDEYLERASGTALAFFTVPKRIIGWEAYETGFYNERVIPAIIAELDAVGRHDKASALRTEWEKKVRYFMTSDVNLFGSEYAFDSTGFESTQALVRYALDRFATSPGPMMLPGPDSQVKEGAPAIAPVTRDQVLAFSQVQMKANLFCRGVVEKAYYLYGSDYRGDAGDAYTLTYMAQMGGWAVMDHALHDGTVPDASVRLGYGSYLSAWALMNTGTVESGFGYWFPGEANDGGAGGGFEPAARSVTWLDQPNHRGSWYYSSEIDLGFCGALRAAATVVADDPVFGRFCFGGLLQETGATLRIEPRDGVRRRLHLRTAGSRIDIELTGARFAAGKAIEWNTGAGSFELPLEREAAAKAEVRLSLRGLAGSAFQVRGAGVDRRVEASPTLQLTVPLLATTGELRISRIDSPSAV